MDMGRGEERVRCMEWVTRKLILSYVKWITNGNLLYGSGNSNRGSVSTWRGGMGREMGGRLQREGIYVYLWLIHVEVWQKTTKFCKAIILQLKKKNVAVKKGPLTTLKYMSITERASAEMLCLPSKAWQLNWGQEISEKRQPAGQSGRVWLSSYGGYPGTWSKDGGH